MTDKQDTPHVPAAFINVIAEEGTKDEAIRWLQKTWNDYCAVKEELTALRASIEAERDKALEDAAKVCDERFMRSNYPPYAHGARDCVEAIRDLKSTGKS